MFCLKGDGKINILCAYKLVKPCCFYFQVSIIAVYHKNNVKRPGSVDCVEGRGVNASGYTVYLRRKSFCAFHFSQPVRLSFLQCRSER